MNGVVFIMLTLKKGNRNNSINFKGNESSQRLKQWHNNHKTVDSLRRQKKTMTCMYL